MNATNILLAAILTTLGLGTQFAAYKPVYDQASATAQAVQLLEEGRLFKNAATLCKFEQPTCTADTIQSYLEHGTALRVGSKESEWVPRDDGWYVRPVAAEVCQAMTAADVARPDQTCSVEDGRGWHAVQVAG